MIVATLTMGKQDVIVRCQINYKIEDATHNRSYDHDLHPTKNMSTTRNTPFMYNRASIWFRSTPPL